ncbi:MAG TPA: Gfo/Idh/MocA family oxidoreductase, partial [Fimbriimonas sp.]
MAKKKVNVGLVGYQFMGKAHSNAYRQVNRFFDLPVEANMHTLCGRNEPNVRKAAETFGWQNVETDWRKLLQNPEIDIVDIATPGNMHAEIAIAAAQAGKAVFCEKPLGNTLDEAERMLAAVEKAGVPNAIFHNYRKAPAVALAKRMID